VNCECQSFGISHKASLGHGNSNCLNHEPGMINGAMSKDQNLTYPYECEFMT